MGRYEQTHTMKSIGGPGAMARKSMIESKGRIQLDNGMRRKPEHFSGYLHPEL
jgi:hypothetical protein